MISLTETAAKQIQKILDQQNVPAGEAKIRVGVKGGGCSGFTYTFEFDTQRRKFDLEFESQGFSILVDKKSHIYINGTEIDWSFSLSDRGLKFNNPAANKSCGCKTSFLFESPQKDQPPAPWKLTI